MLVIPAIVTIAAAMSAAHGQVKVDDADAVITRLREEMVDAFNKKDVDRLISHLDPDIVAVWQDGEVCRGPAAVKAYYEKIFVGPDKMVQSVVVSPKVDVRHVYGDIAVSEGTFNDSYVLTNGSNVTLNSKFTATVARRGDGWKVVSFHASINAFDNPLTTALKKSALWAGVVGAAGGLVVGAIVVAVLKRRRGVAQT